MEKNLDLKQLSEGEREELMMLGMLSSDGTILPYVPTLHHEGYRLIKKRAVSAPDVLNEAYIYKDKKMKNKKRFYSSFLFCQISKGPVGKRENLNQLMKLRSVSLDRWRTRISRSCRRAFAPGLKMTPKLFLDGACFGAPA